jgi:regulator of nucleoside diphosphate kinase
MPRADVLYLRASDLLTLEALIQGAAGGRDADSAARLDEELARATVVPDHALPRGTVALDSRVRFRDETTGRVRDVTLVLPAHATAAEGRISVLSPIGSVLIGLGIHDRIDWPLPGGKLGRLRVLEVD